MLFLLFLHWRLVTAQDTTDIVMEEVEEVQLTLLVVVMVELLITTVVEGILVEKLIRHKGITRCITMADITLDLDQGVGIPEIILDFNITTESSL